jgi:hypothetical protein
MFGTEAQTICGSETVYQLQGNIGGGKKYQHIYSQGRREETKAGEVYSIAFADNISVVSSNISFPEIVDGGR